MRLWMNVVHGTPDGCIHVSCQLLRIESALYSRHDAWMQRWAITCQGCIHIYHDMYQRHSVLNHCTMLSFKEKASLCNLCVNQWICRWSCISLIRLTILSEFAGYICISTLHCRSYSCIVHILSIPWIGVAHPSEGDTSPWQQSMMYSNWCSFTHLIVINCVIPFKYISIVDLVDCKTILVRCTSIQDR